MDLIDRKQQQTIQLMAGVVTILATIVGLVAWMESKKHNKLNDEVLKLDKEIKTLELAIKKDVARQNGVSV